MSRVRVRDAVAADVPVLTALQPTPAHHRDCLREAQRPGFHVLVLLFDQEVSRFVWLVFRRPAYGSNVTRTPCLPATVNLNVARSRRGRGYGSTFIRALEQAVAGAGWKQLYIAVQPRENPRAVVLYQRLGYQPLQAEPYLKVWEFTDSGGVLHHGEDWLGDMVKAL